MKFILTTDNAGAIPAHFRQLEIATDEGRLTIADVRMTQQGNRPEAIVRAAEELVARANAAGKYLDEIGHMGNVIVSIAEERDAAIELLGLAFPFVEEAISDPVNKPGIVKKLAARIREAIEKEGVK